MVEFVCRFLRSRGARRLATIVGYALAASIGPSAVEAQTEPILEQLREAITHEGLTLGVLFQAVVDPAVDSDDPDPASVQLAAARLLMSGVLDGGFEYFLQTNFASSPSVLDARVGWRASEELGIWAGRFKSPFSREFLTFAGSIDFVNRSRAVERLAPGRQMGVQVGGSVGTGASWSMGGFTGPDNSPTNESLMGVARFEISPTLAAEDRTLVFAASAAVGRDGAVAGRALGDNFNGDGALFGLDARMEEGRLMLAGEAIIADYDPTAGQSVDASGLYLTAGWMTNDKTQVLARWDRYRPVGGASDDMLVLGWNFWPTGASELQVNWLIPVFDSVYPHKLLVNFQIGY